MPDLLSPPALALACILVGYLLGSIPFGLLVTKALGLGDPRKIGSGNIGASNVLRTGSRTGAALTLLLDAGKGAIAVLLARLLSSIWIGDPAGLGAAGTPSAAGDAAQLAALGAFVGHCYPVWLRFRGGKGVATYFGIWLALDPVTFLALSATWLIVAWIVRISSVSALATAATAPFWAWFIGSPGGATVALAALMGALVFLRHRHNIARLRTGAEPRIGRRPSENR